MAKHLNTYNVNLAFTADTTQAKNAMRDLQMQLSQIASAPVLMGKGSQISSEIMKASQAAIELKTHLQNAVNVDTGNIDFVKFNQSLKASGKSLSAYGQQLVDLGPQGQQAFMSLARAVAQSELPIRRSNAALQEMWTTLKNTARWQLSSSILHGFMGAVQSAYGYAQDLNQSLNNIRIVTGQNVDQMAKFAEQANKAARALSTTTTKYTDASLIYYQQGLSDAEVRERADITIKMANAAGSDATSVSNQLTAVWNNFDDGTKSLEHYADVMTALGAATASSTDEIAGGLEKFAAIADTIGLSYEYAASALATITSNTRQSEEVVGTALKTIFARIQGLNLGDTLDDGTTLNKYSQALEKVGISIFDQNNQIKDMDAILNEMASKWQRISKDEQIALAQTVAGVRQYTQLVALMDNWNDGSADSMIANLQTSYNSEGALQEQSDIYAEGWEAARERVSAAAQSIYSDLVDEDFFIGFSKTLEGILVTVDGIIDAMGGLKGVISTIGVIATKAFSTQMAQGLRNMAHNVYMGSEGGRILAQRQKEAQVKEMAETMALGTGGVGDEVGSVQAKQFAEELRLQQQLMANSKNMSKEEIANAQQLLDIRRQIGEQIVQAKQKENTIKEELEDSRQQAYVQMGQKSYEDGNDIIPPETIQQFETLLGDTKRLSDEANILKNTFQSWTDAVSDGKLGSEITKLREIVSEIGGEFSLSEEIVNEYMDAISLGGDTAKSKIEELLNLLSGKQGRNVASMSALGVSEKTAQQIIHKYEEELRIKKQQEEINQRAAQFQQEYEKRLATSKKVTKDWADGIVAGANAISSTISVFNILSGTLETLKSPDATGWEKFVAVMTSVSMAVPMAASALNSFSQMANNLTKGTFVNGLNSLFEAWTVGLQSRRVNKFMGNYSIDTEQAKIEVDDIYNEEYNKVKNKYARKYRSKQLIEGSKHGDAMRKEAEEAANEAKSKAIEAKCQEAAAQARKAALDAKLSEEAAEQAANQAGAKMRNELLNDAPPIGDEVPDTPGKKSPFKSWTNEIGGFIKGNAKAIASAGLFAAAIAVVVGTIAIAKHTYEKYNIEAEKANQLAQQASDIYQKASTEYQNFNSTISSYDDGVSGLKSLTRGTVEFREAVIKANESAMELINTYNGIEYEIDSDGLVVIDEESLKTVKEEQLEILENNQRIQQSTALNAREKGLQAERVDFARDELRSSAGFFQGAGSTALFGGAGAATGAILATALLLTLGTGGLFAPLIAAGAGLGLLAGGITAGVAGTSSKTEQSALEELAQVYAREGNARFTTDEEFRKLLTDELELDDQALINSLSQNREATLDLVKEMAQFNKDRQAEGERVVTEEYGSDIYEQAGKNSADVVTAALARVYNQRAEELYESEYADGKGITDARIQEMYAKEQGWNVNSIENLGGNKATYKNEKGEIVAEALSDEVARRYFAEQAALEEIGTQIENYTNLIQQIIQSGNEIAEGVGDALANFIGGEGSFSALSYDQLNDFLKNGDFEGDLTGNSFNFAGTKVDSSNVETLFGFDTVEEAYEYIQKLITSAQEIYENLDDTLTGDARYSDLSIDALAGIQNSKDIFSVGAYMNEGANIFAEGIEDMVSGLSGTDRIDALNELFTLDWSDINLAFDEATEILDKYGIKISESDSKWQDFIKSLYSAAGIIPNRAEELQELFGAFETSQKLETGSIVSEEDYELLVKYNQELEKYFVLMYDGTYKYTGTDSIGYQTRSAIAQELSDLQELNALVNEIQDNTDEGTTPWRINESEFKPVGRESLDIVSDDGINIKDILADPTTYIGNNYSSQSILSKLLGYVLENPDEDIGITEEQIREYMTRPDEDREAIFSELYNKIFFDDTYDEQYLDFYRQQANNILQGNESYREVLGRSGWSEEQINEILNSGDLTQIQAMMDALSEAMGRDYTSEINEGYSRYASTFTSTTGLENWTREEGYNQEDYENNLSALASQYADCRGELEDYNEALESGSPEERAEAEEALLKAVRQAEWRKLTREVSGYMKELDSLKDIDEIATKYQEIADSMNAAFDTNISASFVEENIALFEQWQNSTGEEAATIAEKLKNMALIASTEAAQVLEETGTIKIDIDGDGVTDVLTSIQDRFAAIKGILEANPITIDANGNADMSNLIQALLNAGYTATEVANILASLGHTNISFDLDGVEGALGLINATTPEEIEQALNTIKTTGMEFKATGIGPAAGVADMSNYGSGGGGGSSKPAEKVNKSDIVDRYKEIDDAIDDNTEALERASKAADRLYGDNRLSKMREANKLIQKEIELNKQKRKEAENYLAADRAALDQAAADAGVSFTYDQSGNISNYTAQMTSLFNQLDSLIEQANADGAADETEQEAIDEMQEKIDKVKEAISTYDETRELIEDLNKEIQDQFNEWQDQNFEMLNYELELELTINEEDLSKLDYYLKKVEDDFYRLVEAFTLNTGVGEKGVVEEENGKLQEYLENLALQEKQIDDLNSSFKNGEISEASYMEGLKKANEEILKHLTSIQEVDRYVRSYYGDTLAAAAKEIEKYTNLMENQNKALEHYREILDLVGKQKDFDSIDNILRAQASSQKNLYEVSKREYQTYLENAAAAERDWAAAQMDATMSEEAKKIIEQRWLDARNAADKAYDEMLSAAEDFAKALKEVLENELEGLADILDKSLSGSFGSLDNLETSMDRAKDLQEEYLTTTNKIFETNKLMRTAQQDMDKTQNAAAKRRLKAYIDETQQLQDQAQLSNYELKIQQAKYELLLAEIAAEEARNAKSMVRLSRDSEGNLSYVYTANQDAVDDAAQKLADSQNNLYNIALEGANDYSEKYAQTLRDMNNAILELTKRRQEDDRMTEEEYQAEMLAIKEHYYQQLQTFSNLYQVALTTDSRVIADAWSTDFGEMTTKSDEWMSAVSTYVVNVQDAFAEWEAQVNQIESETIGPDLDSLANKTKDIVDETDNLTEVLIGEGGVVDAVDEVLDAIYEQIDGYINLRNSLDTVIEGYEKLINSSKDYAKQLIDEKTAQEKQAANQSGSGSSNGSGAGGSGTGSGQGAGGTGGGPDEPGGNDKTEPYNTGKRVATIMGTDYYLWSDNSVRTKDGSNTLSSNYDSGQYTLYNTGKKVATINGVDYYEWSDNTIKTQDGSKTLSNNYNQYSRTEFGRTWYLNSDGKYYDANGYELERYRKIYNSVQENTPASAKFATGGYTGEFGPEGKWAVLHEKELVLNKHDTENFLASMDMLNHILDIIDLQAANAQLGNLLQTPGFNNLFGAGNGFQQTVSIEANFPNATDHNEIEEALNNLMNTASQYANRK